MHGHMNVKSVGSNVNLRRVLKQNPQYKQKIRDFFFFKYNQQDATLHI